MGGWPAGYLQNVEELNSGLPKTNPSSGREQDLNPGSPDYKSSALTTRPRCLPQNAQMQRTKSHCAWTVQFLALVLYKRDCYLTWLSSLQTQALQDKLEPSVLWNTNNECEEKTQNEEQWDKLEMADEENSV